MLYPLPNTFMMSLWATTATVTAATTSTFTAFWCPPLQSSVWAAIDTRTMLEM